MMQELTSEEEFDRFLAHNFQQKILVKFFATWCVPCQLLQNNLAKLLVGRTDVIVVAVDVEKFPNLAQRPDFQVRAVPTLFLFQAGQLKKKNSGSMSVQKLYYVCDLQLRVVVH